jgi:hypothetical protein
LGRLRYRGAAKGSSFFAAKLHASNDGLSNHWAQDDARGKYILVYELDWDLNAIVDTSSLGCDVKVLLDNNIVHKNVENTAASRCNRLDEIQIEHIVLCALPGKVRVDNDFSPLFETKHITVDLTEGVTTVSFNITVDLDSFEF